MNKTLNWLRAREGSGFNGNYWPVIIGPTVFFALLIAVLVSA